MSSVEQKNSNEPLRHGWGGDLKLRNQLLKERQEEKIEQNSCLDAGKFGDFIPTEDDYLLLEKMQIKK